jgi:Protein of unknown function (DUF3179)
MREPSSRPDRARRRAAGALILLLVLLALALVVLPLWTIQPFKAQTPEGVAMSYALRRWAPLGTLLAAVAVAALGAWLWRGARWWSRALLVLALVPAAAAVWGARQNVYERMFAPPAGVGHAPAAEASWVGEDDMVLAVSVNGDAVAYPVRQIAYHHVVEDVVGGVPVAATY